MKRIFGVLASTVMALSYAPSAEASAFLSINVDGVIVSCNNTAACGAGFTTVLNGNDISFSGIVNGVDFTGGAAGVQLVGNQPGGVTAFTTDTKTAITNTSGVPHTITISFADNNYSLPLGTPMLFNATQGLDAVSSPVAITGSFTGWGDGSNSLVPGTGVASVTPLCITAPAPPTNSCSTDGPVNAFARAGNFGLNGIESFTLAAGAVLNAHASVSTFTTPVTVPEPGTMLLLGTGLIALGWRAGRRLRKQ
jgi:hypothetical protein